VKFVFQDALSSVIVARDGFGDMAVSNAIGSNVFDIDLGIGLPFVIKSLIDNLKPIRLLSEADQVN
jgi:Ca2+/Na+ antiporter